MIDYDHTFLYLIIKVNFLRMGVILCKIHFVNLIQCLNKIYLTWGPTEIRIRVSRIKTYCDNHLHYRTNQMYMPLNILNLFILVLRSGPLRELNPGPLPPWGRIIPLDQVDRHPKIGTLQHSNPLHASNPDMTIQKIHPTLPNLLASVSISI